MAGWAASFVAAAAFFGLSVEAAEAIGKGECELLHAVASGGTFAIMLETERLMRWAGYYQRRHPAG